jgi:predicted  nucleic acid-binding Zn-ribbon protein
MIYGRIEDLLANGKKLFDNTESILTKDASEIVRMGQQKLSSLSGEADNYRDSCKNLESRLNDAQLVEADKMNELKREKESLEKGVYQFPQDAVDLKEAIESRLRSKYGPEAKAVIVAEAAEILDDRWRNVIEGYLNTQKFYIIVAPNYFYTAFQLYDSIKRQKTVYATGLVDTEKLERFNPVKDAGSLAEEISTDNTAVLLFVDYTLGRVMKCDSIRDLRRYKTSVTDDGVLYQNFVVRAMDPRRWKDPAIGQAGTRLRLEAVNVEIEKCSREISIYVRLITALGGTTEFARLSALDIESIIGAINDYQGLPILEETIYRLKADAESIDKSEIETLRSRLVERENNINSISKEIRDMEGKKGEFNNELRSCTDVILPKLENEAGALINNLETEYNREWTEKNGYPRYERELSSRVSAEAIGKAFQPMKARSQTIKETFWGETRDLRRKYNDVYKMGYDIGSVENDVYDKLWHDFTEIELPGYKEKIEDTRKKALQQFQEDFLSRLHSNIYNARRQIDGLNAAIKGASFGEDTYRFRIIAKPDYKRYYDMIVDDMLLTGGYNLLSEQYNAKYKVEIEELFAIITNDSSAHSTSGYADYEKRIQIFTDYKTYLDFDLEIIKPDGSTERLSKTIGKKSGGETQTPFYIAVLASFVQLYRMGPGKNQNTARLIIFDEAFSKMDGERIIQSINLLRRFGFQAVLATPPDKIPDIATLVDRNLCVFREGRKTFVRAFDPKDLEKFVDGQ